MGKGKGGYFNRAGRRSGGPRKLLFHERGGYAGPPLSIQCFEQRHVECRGSCEPMSRETCGCLCHSKEKPNAKE